jgi:hypothetical protein
MFAEGYSFPHPVLGNEDDISGEFNISLEVTRSENRKIVFENITVEVTNPYVKQQIERGVANWFIKIYCSSTLSTWMFESTDKFEINEDDVFNKVDVQVFIVTKSEIKNYFDASFNPQYGNEVFSLSKNEVIGISGKVPVQIPKVNEKLGLGNIFKFNFHEKNKPIDFEHHHDKIYINYPVTKKGEHPPNMLFSTTPWTAFNIFIVPALSEALRYIEDEPEDASKWDWFSVIDQLLPDDQRTGDNFADAQKILQEELPVLLAYKELTAN